MRFRLLLILAIALAGCSDKVTPLDQVLDFGEVFLPEAVPGSVPLQNVSSAELTLESIAVDNAAFGVVTAVPLLMDGGAEYPMDFTFTPPEDAEGPVAGTATLSIAPKSGAAFTVTIQLAATYTNGDLDGDGHVDTSLGGDDCDDDNAATYAGAEEICDGEDNNCDEELGQPELDQDADGFLGCDDDCDDNDETRYPGAPELCDDLDNDCDGSFGEDELDGDNDQVSFCDGDCEPDNAGVRPGAAEACDGFDTDCDNGGVPPDSEADADGDGWMICEGDCADDDVQVNPGRPDEVCDGLDTDCNNILPEDEEDADGDGFIGCQGDCDDNNPAVGPTQAEICDGLDNDCNNLADFDVFGEVDVDLDGVPSCDDCDNQDPDNFPGNVEICDGQDNDCDAATEPVGGEADGDADGSPGCADCDDADANNFPGNVETCDGQDNDCEPLTVEDADGDGDGQTPCAGDCDDLDATVFDGAPELCDLLDNDCDPATEAVGGEADADADGAPVCGDCDDANDQVFPGNVEICDGLDNDCAGGPNLDLAGEVDADADTFLSCVDCDDSNNLSFPGATEICDGEDNDCDPATTALPAEDDIDSDGSLSCADCNDTDPFNFPGNVETCDGGDNDCDPATDEAVSGDSDAASICDGDCDDSDGTVFPGAAEICDGQDNDCDGDLVLGEDFDSDGDGSLDCADVDCPKYVDNTSIANPDGSQINPWTSLQQGIDAVGNNSCQTLWVEAGTYPGNVVFPQTAQEVRLVSLTGPGATTIDVAGNGRPVTIEGGQTTVSRIEGFTITGGDVVGNGGGISAINSSLSVVNCVVDANEATGNGGGISVDGGDLILTDSVVSDNLSAQDGGGVSVVNGFATVTGSDLFDNDAAGGDGGGLYVVGSGNVDAVVIRGSTFDANTCLDDGAGAYLEAFFGSVSQSTFSTNSAGDWGGGLTMHTGLGELFVNNCIFAGNEAAEGAALFAFSSTPFVDNNTMVDNVGDDVAEPSTLRLFAGVARNNIVAFNSGWGVDDAGGASFAYNDVFGNSAGDWFNTFRTGTSGNIGVDPLFTSFSAGGDPGSFDLTLAPGSQCIDTGHPAAAFVDFDTTPSDMGAYGGPAGDW